MTPDEILASLESLTPQQLGSMHHAPLAIARGRTQSKEAQNKLAPYEHRAFAREATAENPWMGLPIAAGTLAYTPYKMLWGKAAETRSDPSFEQITQGLTGVGEGLWRSFTDAIGRTKPLTNEDIRQTLSRYGK